MRHPNIDALNALRHLHYELTQDGGTYSDLQPDLFLQEVYPDLADDLSDTMNAIALPGASTVEIVESAIEDLS